MTTQNRVIARQSTGAFGQFFCHGFPHRQTALKRLSQEVIVFLINTFGIANGLADGLFCLLCMF